MDTVILLGPVTARCLFKLSDAIGRVPNSSFTTASILGRRFHGSSLITLPLYVFERLHSELEGGAEEMASWLRARAVFVVDVSSFPSPNVGRHTMASRESGALFWILWALHAHVHSLIHIVKNKS